MKENEFIKKEILKIVVAINRVPKKLIYCKDGKDQKLCLSIPEAAKFLGLANFTVSTYLSRGVRRNSDNKIFRLVNGKEYLKIILKERS